MSGNAAALRGLCARLRQRAGELEEAAVELLPFPRQVIRADIALAASRLDALASVEIASAAIAPVGDAGRRPAGTVALCLPGNAVLSNPLAAIGAAHLTGNRTVVRLPRARRRWSRVVEALVDIDTVRFDERAGTEFLARSLDDPDVNALAIFGSDEWVVPLEDAARVSGTRVVFEGAGKDPFLVLDASLAAEAADAFVTAGTYNAGQACTAPERAYVVPAAYDTFVDRVVERAGALRVGEPSDPVTEIGPLARDVAKRLTEQVDAAVDAGATAVLGGQHRPIGDRVLVPPTVVVDVDPATPLMREETFGPVLPICRVSSVDAAVAHAEDSPYGLSATVYGTSTDGVARRLARTHGKVFTNETWLDQRTREPLDCYGARRRSGWVWEWAGDQFVRRDGPRRLIDEFGDLNAPA
jgi:succinate-semialdehyde dehydrogenase/glutarate-semialdehyde dehydrogenase